MLYPTYKKRDDVGILSQKGERLPSGLGFVHSAIVSFGAFLRINSTPSWPTVIPTRCVTFQFYFANKKLGVTREFT